MLMATVILRPNRERPVLQRHPWVFSGAIAVVNGQPDPGAAVDVLSADREWLGRGFWSGRSQIQVRLACWDSDQPLDEHWLRAALQRAIQGRSELFAPGDNRACRLVFSEADQIPGLIVDRYGQFLALQISTQGMAVRRDMVVRILADLLQPQGIYERSDADTRAKEGLPIANGLLWGEAPPEELILAPAPFPGTPVDPPPLLIIPESGQKTGAYLDQVVNRARVAAYVRGADVLDCYCFSGGFSAYAARAGAARLTLLDTSVAALESARAMLHLAAADAPARLWLPMSRSNCALIVLPTVASM